MYEKAAYEAYREAADAIAERLPQIPKTAIVLGSGHGAFAELLADKIVIPYREIPNFPVTTVSYQKGTLVYGTIGNIPVLVMNGRFHYYEGFDMWQTAFPVIVFSLLGVRNLILTNAAGAVRCDKLKPGDLVAVTDHIKLVPDSPARGANDERIGRRFFDMQTVYDRALRALAQKEAVKLGFPLKSGVYAYMAGPQFETPAEIRALQILGADLVGMSTVAEVIQAAQCGIRVLCISCVTNAAAGLGVAACSQEEVLKTAAEVSDRLTTLLTQIILKINETGREEFPTAEMKQSYENHF